MLVVQNTSVLSNNTTTKQLAAGSNYSYYLGDYSFQFNDYAFDYTSQTIVLHCAILCEIHKPGVAAH